MSLNNHFFHRFANQNSLTRDELSNERTVLAYIRTSSTMLVASLGIVQLTLKSLIDVAINLIIDNDTPNTFLYSHLQYRKIAQPTSLFLSIIAIFTLGIGFKQFIWNLWNLAEEGRIKAGRIAIIMLIICLMSVNILIMTYCILESKATR